MSLQKMQPRIGKIISLLLLFLLLLLLLILLLLLSVSCLSLCAILPHISWDFLPTPRSLVSLFHSSKFRPVTPIPFTGADQLQVGLTETFPSSTALFSEWYANVSGLGQPGYYKVSVWAAFDVLEKSLYTAVTSNHVPPGGRVSCLDVVEVLKVVSCSTPLGRVAFDSNRINTATVSIFTQQLPTLLATSHFQTSIVGPSGVMTSSFVYPMPTWEEREYVWTLTGAPSQTASIIIAAMCTFILLTIMVTIVVHRMDIGIRMFHYLHCLSFCLAAAVFTWAVAFLWPADSSQGQCSSYLWIIYLSASYFISIINTKAYRLSVFLTNSISGRRQSRFTHFDVLKYSLGMVFVTLILLVICHTVDPPTQSLQVKDVHRPSTDYHICKTGSTTPTILYIIVTVHFLFSVYCISAVRNGMEAFQDGVVIKEAFVIFYVCVVITMVLDNLGLNIYT